MREQSEAADALLLGRVTFEEMRGYWPLQTDDTTGITDYLNNVSKYVVSATLQDPEWEHTTVLRGALIDEISALKSRPGGDIVTTGSMTLVRDLIAAGLVDEYRLFMYPVVLGHGHRLFADATEFRAASGGEPPFSLGHRAPALPDSLTAPPSAGSLPHGCESKGLGPGRLSLLAERRTRDGRAGRLRR